MGNNNNNNNKLLDIYENSKPDLLFLNQKLCTNIDLASPTKILFTSNIYIRIFQKYYITVSITLYFLFPCNVTAYTKIYF